MPLGDLALLHCHLYNCDYGIFHAKVSGVTSCLKELWLVQKQSRSQSTCFLFLLPRPYTTNHPLMKNFNISSSTSVLRSMTL